MRNGLSGKQTLVGWRAAFLMIVRMLPINLTHPPLSRGERDGHVAFKAANYVCSPEGVSK